MSGRPGVPEDPLVPRRSMFGWSRRPMWGAGGGGDVVRVSAAVAGSLTWIANASVPAAAGEPEMTPAGSSVNSVGKEPPASVQVLLPVASWSN